FLGWHADHGRVLRPPKTSVREKTMAKELINYLTPEVPLDTVAAGTSQQTSSAIDMANCDGAIIITGFVTKAADNLAKLQYSDSSGSGYVDYTSGGVTSIGDVNTGICVFSVHKPTKRYIKAVL